MDRPLQDEAPRRWTPVLAALAALAAGACGEVGTRAGGGSAPVTLRIGADDGLGRPAATQLAAFARAVSELSHGRVRIVPVLHADGRGHRAWDQLVIGMIRDGRLAGGLVPTRAFDTEGVTTLRPLSTPFLVTTAAAAGRIARSPLAEQMLAGVAPIGLVGLALVPDGLRHPFGFRGRRLLGPGDYAGNLIRAPRSDVEGALFHALGAGVTDITGDDFPRAVRSGAVAGTQSEFSLAGDAPQPTVATGNVTFFARINALVLSKAAYARLDAAARGVLATAARRVRDAAIAAGTDEAQAARAFCRSGGTVVLASQTDIEGLARAAAPVVAQLERDTATRSLIGEVRALAAEPSPPTSPVPACRPPQPAPGAAAPPASAAAFPDGVYRATITLASLLARGVGAQTAADIAGTSTLVFRHGHFEHHEASDPDPTGCQGTYAVTAGRVSVRTYPNSPPGCEGGSEIFNARFALTSAGLRLFDVRSSVDGPIFANAFWGGAVWRRIG